MAAKVGRAERRILRTWVVGPGVVLPSNTVTIRTRIDGQIVKVAFQEGQYVKKGALLFVIDPASYLATLDQLNAALTRDRAAFKEAEQNLTRTHALYSAKVIAQQQLESQESTFAQIQGTIRADQAQIAMATLNLSYTRVTSPIAGRVGLKLADVGNIVRATDASALAVVTQVRPIAVIFTLPQQSLIDIVRRVKQRQRIRVEAYTQDDSGRLAEGTLLAIDNQVDNNLGMPKLKALFDNNDYNLWPSQPVSIHVILDNKDSDLQVPASAIHHSATGAFVYRVRTDHTVEARPVQIDASDATHVIITSGLNSGDLIVIDAFGPLDAGSTIDPR